MNDERTIPPFSLQAGIDPERFSARVRETVAGLRQGTLVAEPPMLYAAQPGDPIYAATVAWSTTDRAASGAVNVLNLDLRPEWGVVVTQTCDLVEDAAAKPKRPWVHIAPVYRRQSNRGDRRLIEHERGFDYLCPVTALDADESHIWVADLRLLVPVEKSWLVTASTANGFAEEAGYARLARQLSRLFSRPAYNTSLVEKVLQPLAVVLAEVAERHEGADSILEVGLPVGRSRLDPSTVQVVFILDGPLDVEIRDTLPTWGQTTIEDPPDSVQVLLPRVVQLDDLTAREYRVLDQVDVSAFSPADEPEHAGTSFATEADA